MTATVVERLIQGLLSRGRADLLAVETMTFVEGKRRLGLDEVLGLRERLER